MTHASIAPATPCPGPIRPRYYRTTDGRWKRRTGWMCSVCHRHFFMDADGQMVAGFNLAERPAETGIPHSNPNATPMETR